VPLGGRDHFAQFAASEPVGELVVVGQLPRKGRELYWQIEQPADRAAGTSKGRGLSVHLRLRLPLSPEGQVEEENNVLHPARIQLRTSPK
jgi:hypothetical protein